MEVATEPYPLYNRTYHLYRVSPLHHGDSPLLQDQSLRTHAQRLRSRLKGDSIRGVEVDFVGTEGALPNLGPLERCNWDIIGDEDAWIEKQRQLVDPDASEVAASVAPEQARGLDISLEYERTSYNALLLRDPGTTSSPEGFTSLPLLMIKMPAPIREVVLNYLRTTFDAHISPLKLAPSFLTSTLETYFRHLGASTSTQPIRDVIRQLQLQLSFPTSTTLLKHLDITIATHDVTGFVTRGKRIANSTQTPFTSAISHYLRKHLALNLSHPKVQISKVTCGAFTLATDRLKLLVPDISDTSTTEDNDIPDLSPSQAAAEEFYTALVREATGTGKFLAQELAPVRASSPPSSDGNAALPEGRGRKRAVSTTGSVNNNSKRSRARGKENGRASQDVNMGGL
ncbi:hypothetical protein K491DRAFT_698445 [Lophiostoma macrostomum CBS 122681]|uniref:Kinetochore complex Sim4 subunit Fta1-domain-containing protein n=1 Tax=Lophiostoma macrostomum CBS 122681 TaxID=1314788 RepID=A0A6A6SN43_9PLEO|nr:hypothetical protein K491DRAFT_698445 [Lophiostoma macrostomum CBS 122681]